MQLRPYFRPIAVPDGFDQQIRRALFAEELAKDVENAATDRFAFLLDLFRAAAYCIAFAALFRKQVLKTIYFRLADAVNASEALAPSG